MTDQKSTGLGFGRLGIDGALSVGSCWQHTPGDHKASAILYSRAEDNGSFSPRLGYIWRAVLRDSEKPTGKRRIKSLHYYFTDIPH